MLGPWGSLVILRALGALDPGSNPGGPTTNFFFGLFVFGQLVHLCVLKSLIKTNGYIRLSDVLENQRFSSLQTVQV